MLANKYRPEDWDEVVGQDPIVSILSKQIAAQDFKTGYLFVGPAGVGKTTCARIFARSLNTNGKGIIEIDAASNNSVDNVRDIIDNCKFRPMDSPYKIYVIDEVHMLSTGAFNALLKILEEPPQYVVFILATTEPQKIPATILSRLQRFDFRKISQDTLVQYLKEIVYSEEEYSLEEIDEDVYWYLAHISDGGARDAVNMLETCLSYSKVLDLPQVETILGRVSQLTYQEFFTSMADKDTKSMLLQLDSMEKKGINLREFVKGLLDYIVSVMVSVAIDSACGDLGISDEVIQIADKVGYSELSKWFDKLVQLAQVIKFESHYRYLIQGWVMTQL